MMAPAAEFFKKYQARAAAEGADPLGYYLGGWGNAYISVLGDAVSGANSIVDDKIADYLRNHEFKTIMGTWRYARRRLQAFAIRRGLGRSLRCRF
jgi:branched-chain amino acid transport system substrate-binding protein